MAGTIHRFFTNIICGCIYNKDTRKRVRVILNSPMLSDLRFIRQNIKQPIKKIQTFVGYQARNLLISVNSEYIFKFPLRRSNSDELTIREKRIVDTFIPISPIHIPAVDIFEHNNQLVRRYEFIHGVGLRQIPMDIAMKNLDTLAKQIAKFIYTIGTSDPASIRDLKPKRTAKPGYMYGWTQGDICDNFIVDFKTMKIIAFIDWEDCEFRDFSAMFHGDKRSPHRELMLAVKREYDRLYHRTNTHN